MKTRMLRMTSLSALTVLGLASASPVLANHDRAHDDYAAGEAVFYDRARVLRADPLYEVVRTPVETRECWREERTEMHRQGNGRAGMVAGGIIGGVLGHEVGDGDNRKVATVAGTILGAAVGREMDRDREARPRTVEERHCRVTEDVVEEEYLRGYRVTYQYHGRRFTTFSEAHPGKFLHVQVGVAPVRD